MVDGEVQRGELRVITGEVDLAQQEAWVRLWERILLGKAPSPKADAIVVESNCVS